MIAAVFAAIFSGVTPVVAGRAIKLIGFVRANVIRLSFAIVILGVWSFAFGQGLRGQTLLFVTAGAIGFGIGGLSLLAALPRLGAPLTSLVEETVAAPVAAVVAWFWYSDKLTNNQILFCGVILAGVIIGLVPYVRGANLKTAGPRAIALGVGLALLAALAQGISFAATQRLIGGFAVAVVVYIIARWVWRRKWGFSAADGSIKSVLSSDGGKLTTRPFFWGSLNSLLGPILAVTSTVWAQQTMNAGQVQSIVAMAPLISVPFAFWLEGHKPPRLWYLGAAVAIAGLVLVDLNT